MNEGYVIVYIVRTTNNINGTYALDLAGWLSGSEECASDYRLVVGTGEPDYTQGLWSCIRYSSSTTSEIDGYPYGQLFASVVGVGNVSV